MIGRLERDLEELQLDNIRLQERMNQHERKRKHKVSQSQLGSYHSDDPVLSPTMESVPTRTPYQVPQAAASRGIVVKVHYICIVVCVFVCVCIVCVRCVLFVCIVCVCMHVYVITQ